MPEPDTRQPPAREAETIPQAVAGRAESGASTDGETPEDHTGVPPAQDAEAATVTLTAADRATLEAERDLLLESLRDLHAEHESGELDQDRYESLLSRYSARAARVLRTLEAAVPAPAPRRPPASRQRRWRRRLVVLVPLMAVVTGGALLLPRALSHRDPGQSITGNAQTAADTRASLRRTVAASPGDPAAHRAYARVLLDDGDLVEALQQYDEAARLDPDDAESRAYAGWIVSLAGLPDDALERLDAAIAADPTYPDAHFFRGMVLLRGKGDAAGGARELRRYLELAPGTPLRGQVEQVLAGLNTGPGR